MSDPGSDRSPSASDEPTATPPAEPPAADGGTEDLGLEAPPDDQEMPITEHIEEMLRRLAIVLVAAGVASLIALPASEDLVIRMWYDVHTGTIEQCATQPNMEPCTPPHLYGPLEFLLVRLRVASLAGLLIALPVGVYQIYRFMRPGLYPDERRYYLASVPFSLILGVVGSLFAYFVVLPLLFTYFITYSDVQGAVELAFQLEDTLNLMLIMIGMLAVIFQIPLMIMLAIMMGITTREWLERRRLYFWGAFGGIAFLFGPDPTGMAPLLLAVTMGILFEGTLLLLRWTGRG